MQRGDYDELVEKYGDTHTLLRTPMQELIVGSSIREIIDVNKLTRKNLRKPLVDFLDNSHPDVRAAIENGIKWSRPLTPLMLKQPEVKTMRAFFRYMNRQGRLTLEERRALEKNGFKL